MTKFITSSVFVILFSLFPVAMAMCFTALVDQAWSWPWEWVIEARFLTGLWLFFLCPFIIISTLSDI